MVLGTLRIIACALRSYAGNKKEILIDLIRVNLAISPFFGVDPNNNKKKGLEEIL